VESLTDARILSQKEAYGFKVSCGTMYCKGRPPSHSFSPGTEEFIRIRERLASLQSEGRVTYEYRSTTNIGDCDNSNLAAVGGNGHVPDKVDDDSGSVMQIIDDR
jgi:hypothetical protein